MSCTSVCFTLAALSEEVEALTVPWRGWGGGSQALNFVQWQASFYLSLFFFEWGVGRKWKVSVNLKMLNDSKECHKWEEGNILYHFPALNPDHLPNLNPDAYPWPKVLVQLAGSHCSICLETLKCVSELLSHVWLFVTPWTVAHQAPLSMGFSRRGYWSGVPCSSPGDLSNWVPCIIGGFFTVWARRPWYLISFFLSG